jgi:hypothetical protein
MKIKLAILIFIIMGLLSGYGVTSNKKIPFYPGEKMTYRVRWAFVVAGEVTLEFLPHEKFEDVNSCHFLFTARTSKFVDIFYKVRDRIESYTDENITHSLFYKKRHDGKSKKEISVTFDWIENNARYSDGSVIGEPVSIMPNTFDPLSVFYAFRLYLKEGNNESNIHLTDGKRCIVGRANIIKRDKIRIAGNKYNTFLVEPEMENIGGVFEKSKNAKLRIWVTDDELRIPVRIKSKIKVGSFVADLISYNSGLKPLTIIDQ